MNTIYDIYQVAVITYAFMHSQTQKQHEETLLTLREVRTLASKKAKAS